MKQQTAVTTEELHVKNTPEIRSAVVALELAAPDHAILAYIEMLASRLPLRALHFLHVAPPMELFGEDSSDEHDWLSFDAIRDALNADLKRRVDKRTGLDRIDEVTLEVTSGDPLEELLQADANYSPDLLIIGKNTDRSRHGIWSNKLVRETERNILVVPDRSPASLEHILIPIDFSEYSARALKQAVSLAGQSGNGPVLTCLHVYSTPHVSWFRIQRKAETMHQIFKKDRKEALEQFINKHTPAKAEQIDPLLMDVEYPGVGSFIHEAAMSKGANLIVMGAKGHSRVERLLLGSVTENVLSQVETVLVLVVR